MDIKNLTTERLRQLLENCNSQAGNSQADALAKAVTEELISRNKFQPGKWSGKWNAAEVAEVLEPFRVVAAGVAQNKRKAFTTAGGDHIGRSHKDPEWQFVQTYSAIKTDVLNAVMQCEVKRPGDEAIFSLSVVIHSQPEKPEIEMKGGREILPAALLRWRELAQMATKA
jgi:hypothetical protein